MISILVYLVNSRIAANPVFFAGPSIPTPRRKPREGHPRGAFLRCSRPPLAQARFPRSSRLSERQTNLPLSTALTEHLQLDSSYEAPTPSRLDLVLRQQAASGRLKHPCIDAVVAQSLPFAA